ncbi:MAG: YceI family protein [Gillisia sp.]
MKKHSVLLIAFGMVITMVFVQCKNPETNDTQLKTQEDSSISVVPSETETYIDSTDATVIDKPTTNTDEPTPIVIDKTTEKPKSKVIVKPETTADTPKPVVIDKPIPTIIDNPQDTTVEKTAAPVTADFSMKSVKATIAGTSSLHAWESNITLIEGKGTFQIIDNVITSIKDAEIKITVKGIKSEKGSKMDQKTYETFKADEYPYITYSFNNAVIKINDSQIVNMETIGMLSIAGVSKSVPISAVGKKLPNGDLHLTVSKKIKMTDFGMDPPVMFLGTMKVGDEITVNFDFVLSKS